MINRPLREEGFTLPELMTVVSVILIILSMLLPNVLRARQNTNEVLATKGLRSLSDALEMYRSANNDYPDAIAALLNSNPPYISNPAIVRAGTASGKPYAGYYFNYTKSGAGQYTYTATPAASGQTGSKSFYVNQNGIVNEGSPPPPGPSCPYVYVWDGTKYVKDNDIFPGADNANGGEYTDYYLLSKKPLPQNDKFFLKISEEMPEVSYLDKISLIMVEHPLVIQIAPDPQGNLWTIQTPIPPISTVDNHGKDILAKIRNRGDKFSEIDQGGWALINFGKVKAVKGARIILSTDPPPGGSPCPYRSLHLQILNKNNQWQDVNVIHPHEFWDLWAVDLSKFLPKEGDFKVRLYCTAKHKIDYVALDISKQQPITKTELPIIKINSSPGLKNPKNILKSDNKYVVMNKGDYLELEFPAPSPTKSKRDFLLVSEGYYVRGASRKIGDKSAR